MGRAALWGSDRYSSLEKGDSAGLGALNVLARAYPSVLLRHDFRGGRCRSGWSLPENPESEQSLEFGSGLRERSSTEVRVGSR